MSDIKQLMKLVRSFDPNKGFQQPWEDKVVDELYMHRYSDIGPFALEILETFGKHDSNWHLGGTGPTSKKELMDWSGKSFMELFTRRILPEKLEALQKANSAPLVFTAECWVEGFGAVELLYSDRLKKEALDCKKDLEALGCVLDGYSYLNCRLLLSYYHWIHAPCSGTVKRIVAVPKEFNFFGENSLWLVEIGADGMAPVFLLIVGELNIQDFTFFCKEGQSVKAMDVIGHFGWGSQTLVLCKLPEELEFCVEKNVEHYFVGDAFVRGKKGFT